MQNFRDYYYNKKMEEAFNLGKFVGNAVKGVSSVVGGVSGAIKGVQSAAQQGFDKGQANIYKSISGQKMPNQTTTQQPAQQGNDLITSLSDVKNIKMLNTIFKSNPLFQKAIMGIMTGKPVK